MHKEFECQEPLSRCKCTNRDRDRRQRDINLGTGTKDVGIGMVAPVRSMKEYSCAVLPVLNVKI